MEIENVNNETCKYLTKQEIIDECEERLTQNKNDLKEILDEHNCKNVDELINLNDKKNIEHDLNDVDDIEADNEFLNSILYHIRPHKKLKVNIKKNNEDDVKEADRTYINKLKRRYKFNNDVSEDECFKDIKTAFLLKCDKCKKYQSINNYNKYNKLYLLCNKCDII